MENNEEAPYEKSGIEKDSDTLRNITSRLSEHFDDYLILVRSRNMTCSMVSDKTWSVGAAEIYLTHVKNQALIDKIDDAMEDS